jgi:hypothetical protein
VLAEVTRAAWCSSAEESAQRRIQRWQDILQQLEINPWPQYQLNTAAGRKVYLAALQRCLQRICAPPMAATTVLSLQVTGPSVTTGLMAYLAQWLRERLALHPQLWHNRVTHLAPTAPDDTFPLLTHSISKNPEVQQVRREYWEQHAAIRARLSEQEMRSRMIDQELRLLAVPMAILAACQAQPTDSKAVADSHHSPAKPVRSPHFKSEEGGRVEQSRIDPTLQSFR